MKLTRFLLRASLDRMMRAHPRSHGVAVALVAGWLVLPLSIGAQTTPQGQPTSANRGNAEAPPTPQPAGVAVAKPPVQGSASTSVPVPPAEAFTYQSAGRRDPFVSLVKRGTEEVATSRATGLGGLDVGEVSLRGIVATQGTFVAMLQAPDNRTYLIRQNDLLRDARVKAITADGVVFLQKVSDPLDVVKEREVRKPLRPNEEGK